MGKRERSYFDRVQRLRTGRVGDHERPHEPAMLLAIADLIAAGKTAGNRIAYSPDLLEVFRRYFDLRDRSVLVPTNQRYHPRRDALRWRQERLRK